MGKSTALSKSGIKEIILFMPSLAVIIPTYNEEPLILDAIKSVDFADEIILLDSYSTDNTVELSKPYCSRVIQRKFDNFSNQKNAALEVVNTDWVLFLDADERVTPELRDSIIKAIHSKQHEAYKVEFVHYYMDRFLYHHTDKTIRLVCNTGYRFVGEVHEHFEIEGETPLLKGLIKHYTYKDFDSYLKKKMMYGDLQSEQFLRKNKSKNLFLTLVKPNIRFIKSVLIKKGYKDGFPAMVVGQINGYGVFQRLVKANIREGRFKKNHLKDINSFNEYLHNMHIRAKLKSAEITGENVTGWNAKYTSWITFMIEYVFKGNIFNGYTGLISAYLKGNEVFISKTYGWLHARGLK